MNINNLNNVHSTLSTPMHKINSYASYPAQNSESTYETQANGSNLSPAAKLLSRNQANLRNALAARPEVLKQYASAIHDPVQLQDRSIDRILHNLQSV